MAIAENVSMEAMWDSGTGQQLPEVTSSSSETFGGHGFPTSAERRTSSFLCYWNLSIFSLLWSENLSQELEIVTLHPPLRPRERGGQSLRQWFMFSRWKPATKKISWFVSPHSEPSVLGYCVGVISATDQKASDLFMERKAMINEFYLLSCSY